MSLKEPAIPAMSDRLFSPNDCYKEFMSYSRQNNQAIQIACVALFVAFPITLICWLMYIAIAPDTRGYDEKTRGDRNKYPPMNRAKEL